MAARVNLSDFLDEVAGRPFAWGRDDCSLFLADWWLANHGEDPAAELRRAYDSEAACHELVRSRGGLVRLVTSLAAAVGARRTRRPAAGDFGIIRAGDQLTCAISTGSYWAVRNEQVGFLPMVRAVRAWRI